MTIYYNSDYDERPAVQLYVVQDPDARVAETSGSRSGREPVAPA